jgi:hypothetical protein
MQPTPWIEPSRRDAQIERNHSAPRTHAKPHWVTALPGLTLPMLFHTDSDTSARSYNFDVHRAIQIRRQSE